MEISGFQDWNAQSFTLIIKLMKEVLVSKALWIVFPYLLVKDKLKDIPLGMYCSYTEKLNKIGYVYWQYMFVLFLLQ